MTPPARPLACKPVMDEIERDAIRAEGYGPDDPEVIATLARVRAELAAVGWITRRDARQNPFVY